MTSSGPTSLDSSTSAARTNRCLTRWPIWKPIRSCVDGWWSTFDSKLATHSAPPRRPLRHRAWRQPGGLPSTCVTHIFGSFEDPPLVRLVQGAMRCYDEACDEPFGRRTDEGYLLFLPGWVYQGEIWRDEPLEESWKADGGDVEDL